MSMVSMNTLANVLRNTVVNSAKLNPWWLTCINKLHPALNMIASMVFASNHRDATITSVNALLDIQVPFKNPLLDLRILHENVIFFRQTVRIFDKLELSSQHFLCGI